MVKYWIGQKVLLGLSCKMVYENLNELFGQPNTYIVSLSTTRLTFCVNLQNGK